MSNKEVIIKGIQKVKSSRMPFVLSDKLLV